MGRKRRLPRRRPPPPPPGTSLSGFVDWLGHDGDILVLFETPSGFALFYYDGLALFRPNALEDIWADFVRDDTPTEAKAVFLKEFQIFEDKASAIKPDTGVSGQLAKMIKKWLLPRQILAVGKSEYKTIIEASMGISCLFNEAVMEVMWGLKNLMKTLVPGENLELTKEDRLQMSQGMKIVLDRYGFNIKPEMVNSDIIEMAHAIYQCDTCVKEHAGPLQIAAKVLKEVSDINYQNWDPLKLVTAIKIICYPEEKCDTEMFSDDERSKLLTEAPKYKGKFYACDCLKAYEEIVWAHGVRDKAKGLLRSLVKEAREAYKADQAELPEKPQASGLRR